MKVQSIMHKNDFKVGELYIHKPDIILDDSQIYINQCIENNDTEIIFKRIKNIQNCSSAISVGDIHKYFCELFDFRPLTDIEKIKYL